MLIDLEYSQAIKYTEGLEDGIFTSLKAKLSFKEEVAPKDVPDIQERLKWKEPVDSLRNYFNYVEKMNIQTPLAGQKKYFLGSERKVRLKENLRRLRLEIKITSKGDILKKDMFDLEALNTFILTGK